VKTDWSATRAFCVVADLQGYVRINLQGREAAGIVQPGREYDALCEEIVAGLQTFVDADTGEPVVRDAARCDALYPGGARLGELPDLSFRWATTPVSQQRAIVSPRFGTIELPTPGHNENGRSGNHRPEGFLIASGAGFSAGSTLANADILDLAPTAYARLGLPRPSALRGRPL
jgi:predicted AlkP superfamily phosphohydrolase/phosphomutase